MSRLVSSYLTLEVMVEFKIMYPADYPWNPPQWSVDTIKYNIGHSFNLLEYYQYIVQIHNEMLRKDWSPAISLDKDFIDFLQKINHFEYILHPDTFTQ